MIGNSAVGEAVVDRSCHEKTAASPCHNRGHRCSQSAAVVAEDSVECFQCHSCFQSSASRSRSRRGNRTGWRCFDFEASESGTAYATVAMVDTAMPAACRIEVSRSDQL